MIFSWFWVYGIPDCTSYAIYIDGILKGIICDTKDSGIAIYLKDNKKIYGRGTAAISLYFHYLNDIQQLNDKNTLVLKDNIASLRLMWKLMEKYTLKYDKKLKSDIIEFHFSKDFIQQQIINHKENIITDNLKTEERWNNFLYEIKFETK